jgi:hypothetical protein
VTPKRHLGIATAICAGSAALALYAASRTWLVVTTPRPEPLHSVTVAHSGGALAPAFTALALVALAGAGGLLATRGRARQLVGALIMIAGAGMIIALIVALLDHDGLALGWVFFGMLAAIAVGYVGLITYRHGRSWPGMGARYERAPARPADGARRSGGTAEHMWDAIDRGEDPTRGM